MGFEQCNKVNKTLEWSSVWEKEDMNVDQRVITIEWIMTRGHSF